jgi:hypothetical protein
MGKGRERARKCQKSDKKTGEEENKERTHEAVWGTKIN